MIRVLKTKDLESILDIWLKASIKAHDFVPPEFWKEQLNDMRNIYIPSSKTYVYEKDSKILGFYSLVENCLAAIFVAPSFQGFGIGKELLCHAKSKQSKLTLTVYKKNISTCNFYLSQGFYLIKEQIDENTGHIEYLMATTKPS